MTTVFSIFSPASSFQDGVDVLHNNQGGRYAMETIATKSGIQSILIINQIVREDEGLYTCSMSNPYGRDAQVLKVIVQGMECW